MTQTTLPTQRRRTRILATLGPATDPPGVLDALLKAGVDVVRLNFSHGDPSSQMARAQAVREAAQRVGVEVGILADLPGPKLRIERFAEGRVQLKAGEPFDLVARADAPPALEMPRAFGDIRGRFVDDSHGRARPMAHRVGIGEQREQRRGIVGHRRTQADASPFQGGKAGHGKRMQRNGRFARLW